MSLLSKRVPIEKALLNPKLTEKEKQKLLLAEEVMQFCKDHLGLDSHGNYSSFVQLDQAFVTYVVSASPAWELKHYLWSFPIVGSVPYKGFFNKKDAEEEEKQLKQKKFDTYLRGVSAFSTLGWFRDPVLSSMLRYEDEDFVNTLIHETVHANIYIKSNADFNERLAVFLGNWGTEKFYLSKNNIDMLEKIKQQNNDEKLFAHFISDEIRDLEVWYKKESAGKTEEDRKNRIKDIQKKFNSQILPKLKTNNLKGFADIELNNARLLIYKTYLQDLSLFERLADLEKQDFVLFLKRIKQLEKSKDPEKDLKEIIQ